MTRTYPTQPCRGATKRKRPGKDKSTESTESNATTEESPPVCELDVESTPHTHTGRERMMPPDEKLGYFECRAQAMADNQQFDACISDLVRCVALAKLAHGDRHLKEAESSYLIAGQILEELYEQDGVVQEEKNKTELKISTALSRLYQRRGRPEEALAQCEKSLQLLGDGGDPGETCSVYRDMAAIEQSRGSLDRAIEHLTKAHAIAVSQSPGGPDRAHISYSLAMVHSSAAGPHHNESAAHYFEESLGAFKDTGPQDPTFLKAQDDYCHFLLINGKKERCVELQKASLAPKRCVFGEWSAEVSDSLQLIGGVEMTQGRIIQAHRTLRKCLEIQSIAYGPQHKKTKDTQKTVDMLARAPEVENRPLRQSPAAS
ncbi:hypothetical protein NHX12_002677 [Muraenolepis orangiensis]|uniref:MalT-like TPR region domain-containing protein n=1 Tax=Muraenolepis orangiensis TaxID=630683 RepID=A0A9Q0DZ97_9TELE|nr:hypothetical protein NHX12_002677 [Muraenolepis orangiensis]